jgi:predicted negative regulator of RcsB-dependent stress response
MIFLVVISGSKRKVIVGTNKLTRKEILAEDPVHEAMVRLVEFFQTRGRTIGLVVVAVAILSLAIYGGLQFLGNREMQAQERLAKAMEFFHGQVAPDATDDPYGKGPVPVFKSDAAKYQAAAREFSSLASGYGYSKVSIIARYYLGLTQLELGQNKEAVKNLESVAANSRSRAVGYLAKKILARNEAASGNYKAARETLEGMIKDPQCAIPREDLSIELSRVLVAQGKRDEAIKVLREAGSEGAAMSALKQQVAMELDKIQKSNP